MFTACLVLCALEYTPDLSFYCVLFIGQLRGMHRALEFSSSSIFEQVRFEFELFKSGFRVTL